MHTVPESFLLFVREDHLKEGEMDIDDIHQPSNPPADPFADLVQDLRQMLQPPVTTSLPDVSASPMAQPATNTGAAEDFSSFILQCVLYFDM